MKNETQDRGTMSENKSKSTKKKKTANKKKVKVDEFQDLQGKFMLVKVGTAQDPASESEISAIRDQLIDLFEKNNVDCLAFVTHHAVAIDIIEVKSHNGEV